MPTLENLSRPIGPKPEGDAAYRVWIVRLSSARSARGLRPSAVEPAEPEAMSAAVARRYVAAFNRTAVELGEDLRAVALPLAATARLERLAAAEATRYIRRMASTGAAP
jgi:hypothetical protein